MKIWSSRKSKCFCTESSVKLSVQVHYYYFKLCLITSCFITPRKNASAKLIFGVSKCPVFILRWGKSAPEKSQNCCPSSLMCSKSWYHLQNQPEPHTLSVCQFLVSWITIILEENNYAFIQTTMFIKVVLLEFSVAGECVRSMRMETSHNLIFLWWWHNRQHGG